MGTLTKPGKATATKLLVVEDEGEMRLVLDMILQGRDMDIDYANSLLNADEQIEKFKPSVMILDNKLPDGYGVDSIGYFKKKYPGVKIIMISGFSTVRDVALNNGADVFFEKPFTLTEFYDAIDRLAN